MNTTEIKDVGSTKIDVPDDIKKKLEPAKKPQAEKKPEADKKSETK